MSEELRFTVTLETTGKKNAIRMARAIRRMLEWGLLADVSGTEILNEDNIEKITVEVQESND